jgi:DNA-binding GntR family transcriptional regulator
MEQAGESEFGAEPADGAELYQQLRLQLLDGSIAAGSAILETSLSAQLGVSRTPIREALLRLEWEGLLDRAARGFRIRRRSPNEVLQIYEARMALEVEAAAAAAQRSLPLDLARLRHLQEQGEQSPDEATSRLINGQWHRALRAAAHNESIRELVERLNRQLDVAESISNPQGTDLAANVQDHARVLDSIARRDPDAARVAMTAHLERVRDLRMAAFVRSE